MDRTKTGVRDFANSDSRANRATIRRGARFLVPLAGLGLVAGLFCPAALAQGTPLPLTYNFNGITHAGETGIADDLNGYRSISDRGLLVTGAAGQFGTDIIAGPTGLVYTINLNAFQLDIVHLGNRAVLWPYDDVADADNIGVRPDWQPDPDQNGPQTSDVSAANITLTPNSQIGVAYNISNGGGAFDVTLNFTDSSSVTVRLGGPDWFGGTNAIPTALPGVVSQQRIGGASFSWPATNNNDAAGIAPVPGQNLSVMEGLFSVPQLVVAGKGMHAGKTLESITFSNSDQTSNRGYAIYAATHVGSDVFDPTGIGQATPSSIPLGDPTKLKVAAIPASGAMNAITSVTVNASALGLASDLALNDSGADGDDVAGDSLWSADIVVPGTAPAGPINLPFTITDEQDRFAVGDIALQLAAPPATTADLGTLTDGVTIFDGTLDAGTVKWIRFRLASSIDRSLLQFLDIDTEGSSITGTTLANNTIIGLYNAIGARVATDDNDGSDNLSQLTWGLATPARPAVGNGLTYTGRDGATLGAGTYFLAYAAVSSTFNAANFDVTTTSVGAGTIRIRLHKGVGPTGGLPTEVTDLGVIAPGTPVTSSPTIEAGTVHWFRFVIDTNVSNDFRHYLDIDTEGSEIADTNIGLFRDTGALVTSDNDDGTAQWSQLTYGRGTRPAPGDGQPYNGRDGANTITAGTYYLAVAEGPVTFAANFVVGFPTGTTSGQITVNLSRGVAPPPTPTILAGPIVNPANGNSYFLFQRGLSFWDAEDNAVLMGGHLASIQDIEENEWVRVNVLGFDGADRRGWIGFTDFAEEGNFVWTDGSPVVFSNWNGGEPNNAGGTEHYTELLGSNGGWNDLGINGVGGGGDWAIVEIPAPGCTGDTNCDDAINFDDIDAFVTALISREAYESAYPTCIYENADANGDEVVNFDDIDPFIVLLISPPSCD